MLGKKAPAPAPAGAAATPGNSNSNSNGHVDEGGDGGGGDDAGFEDDGKSTATGTGAGTASASGMAKDLAAYRAKFLPLERAETRLPDEAELEAKLGLGNDPAWVALPEFDKLNILRAYAHEGENRAKVTMHAAKAITAWRSKYDPGARMLRDGPVPGFERYFDSWPTRFAGEDEMGHPILYDVLGELDVERLMALPEEDFFRFRTQALQAMTYKKLEASRRRGHRVSKHVYVLDIKALSMSTHFSSRVKEKMKPVLAMASDLWPETLWSMWIIAAPATFRVVWSAVRQILDPVVRAKVRMFGHTKGKWIAAMAEAGIPAAALPVEFGGTSASETLRQVLNRAHVDSLSTDAFSDVVRKYVEMHAEASDGGAAVPPTTSDDAKRHETIVALQRKYAFPVFPTLVRVSFGPGPMGMRIDKIAVPNSASSLVAKLGGGAIGVVGFADGPAERTGLIRAGWDLIYSVGGVVVLGKTEADVKKVIVESARPVEVVFLRMYPASLV